MADSDDDSFRSDSRTLGQYVGWTMVLLGGLILAVNTSGRRRTTDPPDESGDRVRGSVLGEFWGTSLSGGLLYLLLIGAFTFISVDGPVAAVGVTVATLLLWGFIVSLLVSRGVMTPMHAAEGPIAALKANFLFGLSLVAVIVFIVALTRLVTVNSVVGAVTVSVSIGFLFGVSVFVGGGALSMDRNDRVLLASVVAAGVALTFLLVAIPSTIAMGINAVTGLGLPTKYDPATRAELLAATVPVAVGKLFAALVHAASFVNDRDDGHSLWVVSEVGVGAVIAILAYVLVVQAGRISTSTMFLSDISIVAFVLTLLAGSVADLSRSVLVVTTAR
ncbi:hypothetical protein [Salinigranum sp. GCM10025319]|uniref:hypothetical protein n=1 Tax=Salinigranum sp. GCM10025319 TaxID=3252687 RepID=UPI0036063E23